LLGLTTLERSGKDNLREPAKGKFRTIGEVGERCGDLRDMLRR